MRLREEATRLLNAAQSVASQYEAVRSASGSSLNRTVQLEALVQEARDLTGLVASPDAVEQLFRTGRDGNRILAIVMMQTDPRLASPLVLAEAIGVPRSAFEQYHALRAAEAWRRDGLFLSRTMEDERAHGRYVGVCEMAQAFGDAARSLARVPSHAELVARRAA